MTERMITDEMVEAAAKAYWLEVYGRHRKSQNWPDDVYGRSEELFRAGCRAALSAALTPSAGEAEPVAWLAEVPGWGRVFIGKEAAEKLAAQGGTLKPLYTHPSPSASEAQVRVKALEWDGVTGISAECAFGVYHIARDGNRWTMEFGRTQYDNYNARATGLATDFDAALIDGRASAQADYERRIMSALSTPEQGGGTEAGGRHLRGKPTISVGTYTITELYAGRTVESDHVFMEPADDLVQLNNLDRLSSVDLIEAACRAHTPQFDRMDAEIQKYAAEQMAAALETAGLGRFVAALTKIADMVDNEDADLDDAISIASAALSSTATEDGR